MVYYVYIYIHTYISLSGTIKYIFQNVRQLIMFDLVYFYFYFFGIWFYVELDIHSIALTVLVLYGHWSV